MAARGHKQFNIRCYEVRRLPNGVVYGRETSIGNASTLKSAKAMISRYRRENQEYEPQDFNVYDCWAELDPSTNYTPVVYQEN